LDTDPSIDIHARFLGEVMASFFRLLPPDMTVSLDHRAEEDFDGLLKSSLKDDYRCTQQMHSQINIGFP
jgi:hypothetical protein